MKWKSVYAVITAAMFTACGPAANTEYDSESLADYHMRVADSLEAASALSGAALEYKLVAELYPKTSHYPTAVRNTALIYSNPAYPAANDSASLQWFQSYLALSIPREEKVKAEIYVSLLNRLVILRREADNRSTTIDSLLAVTRRSSNEVTTRAKRIQELEADLKQTALELQRLRDVDVRINRRKGGK